MSISFLIISIILLQGVSSVEAASFVRQSVIPRGPIENPCAIQVDMTYDSDFWWYNNEYALIFNSSVVQIADEIVSLNCSVESVFVQLDMGESGKLTLVSEIYNASQNNIISVDGDNLVVTPFLLSFQVSVNRFDITFEWFGQRIQAQLNWYVSFVYGAIAIQNEEISETHDYIFVSNVWEYNNTNFSMVPISIIVDDWNTYLLATLVSLSIISITVIVIFRRGIKRKNT